MIDPTAAAFAFILQPIGPIVFYGAVGWYIYQRVKMDPPLGFLRELAINS